ncbi:cation-translocating P-type ATPase [Olivibacter sp. LS-1]|nr:cation-translocating P-type ATPase [Olivibacter sp. LS-1]
MSKSKEMLSKENIETASLPVLGVTFAACGVSVESMIKSIFGVHNAEVNYATQTVKVVFDSIAVQLNKFKEVLQSIGYDLILDTEKGKEVLEVQKIHYKALKSRIIATSILTIPIVILGMFLTDMSCVLATLVLFIFGKSFFINAYKQAKHGEANSDTIDAAKITLVSFDLQQVYKTLCLSRQTVKTIRQNLFWPFIYNLIGIPIAAGILYPINGFLLNPIIAGAAMTLSSVSVVSNSIRLK